ncbi:MAG: 16S rRNA (cytosine(1402)-N(4))-methyltransferase RsmH [Planctomycetes bacterium]|nr:16S rRNA (cytosine(1402)-N(4))-methyltransferase RsmH [Planctomycetota bacterium]
MTTHTPVLPNDTLALLAARPGEVAVDLTAGRGGHAVMLAEAVRGELSDVPAGRVILFDRDPANLEAARARVEETGTACDAHAESFVAAGQRLEAQGLRADVVLADLGFSSTQMDDPDRGFSFRSDGPLDMRFDRSSGATAADLVATFDEDELTDLIRHCGEDPFARKIARKVVQTRDAQPIDTTAKLAGLVVEAYGARARASRMHPATRTFMALRIAVNEELEALRMLLESIETGAVRGSWLNAGARIAIISFHSLEDRMVKHAFADWARRDLATRLTKKPLMAGASEVEANPRSRSARLRAVRMTGP